MKRFLWKFTYKYKFLRPIYFYLVKIKNIIFSPQGYWIPKNKTLYQFFDSIKNLNYVCFSSNFFISTTKSLDYNQDIDLLVDDSDLNKILKHLSKGRPKTNSIRVDIYNKSGLYPYTFKGIPIFPTRISEKILHSKISEGGINLPNFNDQLYITIFRAIYIKGMFCLNSNNKYSSFIQDRLKLIGENFELNFYNLNNFMEKMNFSLPLDSQDIIKSTSKCLQQLVDSKYKKYYNSNHFVTFIVRKDISNESQINRVRERLVNENFKIISEKYLDSNQIKRVSINLRGGNWESLSVNVGSEPIYYFFVDYMYDNFSEVLVAKIKKELRQEFHKNFIHSSDSSHQALYYIETIEPDIIKKLTINISK